MKALKYLLAIAAIAAFAGVANAALVINEIDYDADGTDAEEYVELFGTPGMSLAGWELYLYNGSSSSLSPYNTIDLSVLGTVPADGFIVIGSALVANVDIAAFTTNGIQNGAPDGLLLASGGTAVELLSYEGSFTGAAGPGTGLLFPDIGVADYDPGVGDPERALQRFPNGTGAWIETEGAARNPGTPGTVNVPEPTTLAFLALGGLALIRRR